MKQRPSTSTVKHQNVQSKESVNKLPGIFGGQLAADLRSAINIKTQRWLLFITMAFYLLLATGKLLVSQNFPSDTLVVDSMRFAGETAPFLFGVFGVFATASDTYRSSISYALLATPNRSRVFLWRCLTVAFLVVAQSILALIAFYVIGMIYCASSEQLPRQSYGGLLTSSTAFILLSVVYALLGAGIGFLFQRPAASVLALIGLVWGIPVLAAVLIAFGQENVGSALLDFSPALLSTRVVSESVSWGIDLIKFSGWAVLALALSCVRFRRYTPS